MRPSLIARLALAAVAFIPAAVPAAPVSEKQEFTLAKYLPQDCWMVVHGVHNPERDFIEAHWARVFEALKGTGIGEELKALLFSGAPPEQRAQVESGWETAMKLVGGVRWGDLVQRELLFAERLNQFVPEIILICRSTPDSVEGNVAGLRAIMEQIATLTGTMAVTESALHGVPAWRLAGPDMPVAFFLLRKDDVVGIVMGEKAANEIAALLSGHQTSGAIASLPRFQKALAEVPPAEDSIGYFDLKMLMSDLDGIFETAFKRSGHHGKHRPHPAAAAVAEGSTASAEATTRPAAAERESQEMVAKRIISKMVDQFDFIDYVVFSSHTDGLQEFTGSVVRLQPACKQKSMCKMFTSQRPFERFDKYVPKEATGFWLWDGVDLTELYTAILNFIRDEVPGGSELLAKWSRIQQDKGFNLESDLLSWWSGELISVSLPPAIRTPFATSDSVFMVRVKDARLAREKVMAGVDRLNDLLKQYNQTLIVQDATDVRAEGFRSVTHPMFAMVGKLVIGVADEHLILGSSAESINKCLDTAAGKAPSIVENPRFKAEGLIPKGPVSSASFTDLSNLGQELAGAFFMMGFVSQMIPDQPETKPIKAVFGLLGKLSTAINEINFFNSSAAVCEFDGEAWRTKQVLTYKPTPPRTEQPQDVAQKP